MDSVENLYVHLIKYCYLHHVQLANMVKLYFWRTQRTQ